MSDTSPTPIRSAIAGAIGPLIGALIGAAAAIASQSMQEHREVASQCQATVSKQEEVIRQKAETFLVALSEQIAFFRQNNTFDVRKAREKLGEVQKAAFALSAYAGQELSLKSLAAVNAIEESLVPTSPEKFQRSVTQLNQVMSEWHPTFRAELQSLGERRARCRSAT